ncbi:MAG: glycosyltransferase family 4 protein [Paucibacter sp.]|nr:glycosyltransferase family 4 protein [Roseateles sp.]
MKIGILGHGFIEWGGGLDFLRLVCGSLATSGEPLELHLLLPTRGPRLAARQSLRQLKHALKTALGRSSTLARTPDARIVTEFVQGNQALIQAHEIDAGQRAIAAASRRLRLDALMPSVQPLDPDIGLPWLGYIADFQHAHLPHFFSEQEIAARNRNFSDMLERSRCVIVNARAVANDIERLLPGRPAKVVAMPFSAAPNPSWFELDEPPLEKYGIHSPFFIISNQFWQHKDHLSAYRAFARLREQHPQTQLVCTGETSDFRNPAHFPMLCREAEALGIASHLRVLGLIPKRDQIALMRAARAVVQPTLFEGGPGGGSVFDAVALGVPALVSDIEVNLEIDESNVSFFKASDADALARAMAEVLNSEPAERPAPQLLIEAGQRRRRACGDALLAAIHELAPR